jgi:hypothetical protein
MTSRVYRGIPALVESLKEHKGRLEEANVSISTLKADVIDSNKMLAQLTKEILSLEAELTFFLSGKVDIRSVIDSPETVSTLAGSYVQKDLLNRLKGRVQRMRKLLVVDSDTIKDGISAPIPIPTIEGKNLATIIERKAMQLVVESLDSSEPSSISERPPAQRKVAFHDPIDSGTVTEVVEEITSTQQSSEQGIVVTFVDEDLITRVRLT